MKRAKRRCNYCDEPLPRGSRRTRVYCSTSCRVRDWHRRNPASRSADDEYIERLFSRQNRKHYHYGRGQLLVGHRDNEPWFGSSCPPECPGLREGEEFLPMEPFHRRRVEVTP